jgi:Ca2+-transporting ATPase
MFSREKLPPNKYLQWALGGSLVLQAGAMFLPWFRTILGLTPVGLLDGLVIGGTALLPLVVNEATKRPPEDNAQEEPENGAFANAAPWN